MISDKSYETVGRIWVFLMVLSLLGSIIAAGLNYYQTKRAANATPVV